MSDGKKDRRAGVGRGAARGGLPPDRSALATERRNPRTMKLHAMSTAGVARVIHQVDADVHRAVGKALPAIVRFVRAAERGFSAADSGAAEGRAGGRLIYVGAGTSGRLGVLDASEAPPTFCVPAGRIVGLIAGGDAALRKSSEGLEDDADGAMPELRGLRLTASDSVLAIAAGGTTPFAVGALRLAKAMAPGCVTGLLCCAKPPMAVAACDHLIVLATGPEALTGSTRMKAGTATKMALNIISTTLMVRGGRVHENLMVDVRASNAKLRDRGARIISTLTGLERARAFEVLDDAGGSVKTAVVIALAGVDRREAEQRLAANGGRLDGALRAGGGPSKKNRRER